MVCVLFKKKKKKSVLPLPLVVFAEAESPVWLKFEVRVVVVVYGRCITRTPSQGRFHASASVPKPPAGSAESDVPARVVV